MLGFVAVVFVVLGLIHLYLWKRLVRDPLRPGRRRRIGTVAIVLLAILVPATLIGTRSERAEWLAWPGFIWMATMFYLLVVLAVLELPRLAVSLAWRRADRRRSPAETAAHPVGTRSADPAHGATPAAPVIDESPAGIQDDDGARTGDPATRTSGSAGPGQPAGGRGGERPGIDRRLVLARGAAIFAGLTAAGLTGYGVRTALGPPRLTRVQMPMAKLPRTLDGLKLAVVSDIHLGPLTGPRHAARIVDVINSTDADIVCIVGDLVDGTVAELGRFAEPLAGIRSRQGAYFVTGNHEYYSGHQEWVAEVARLGVRPLRNERLELGGLDLAGVNDPGGAEFDDGPDFARALGDRDPARPVVLMAHQPVVARDAAAYGVDLQVSGHTHGGQMVPFNLLVKLQQPVVSGFGEVDGVPVYVTDGAGFWGPPVRVGVPPEVSLIELRSR